MSDDLTLRLIFQGRDAVAPMINGSLNPALAKATLETLKVADAALNLATTQEKLEAATNATAMSLERLRAASAQADLAEEKVDVASTQAAIGLERLRMSAAQADLAEARLAEQQARATAQLKEQQAAAKESSGILSGLGQMALLTGGMFAVGLGQKVVQVTGDYQTALLKTQSLAGLTKDQINTLSQQILTLAPQVGQAPVDLANSLYFLASAGVPANQMLNTMRLSAEMAATGHFDAKISADALTSSINSLGLSYSQAGNIADEMTQTVTQGKMEMSDYAKVAGQVATGVKTLANSHDTLNHAFQEGNAALATFTQQNGKAQLDSTRLNMLFLQLGTNTDKLAKNFDKLSGTSGGTKAWNETIRQTEIINGKMYTVTNTIHHAATAGHILGGGFDVAKFSTMDLADKITYLDQITSRHHETQQQQQAELLKIFSGNTRVLQTYDNLRDSLGAYEQNLKKIQGSEQNGKTTTNAFAITQQGFNQKMKEAHAALDVLFIKIGTDLLPVLDKFLNVYVIPLIQKFTDWITTSGFLKAATQDLQDILTTVGQVVGGLATGLGDVIGWFQQGSAPAQILGTAIKGIGLAIAGVKVAGMIADFSKFATTTAKSVTTAISNIIGNDTSGLKGVSSAAQTASNDMSKMGPAVVGSENTIKGAAPGIAADLMSALGPLFAIEATFGPMISNWIATHPAPGASAGQTIFPGHGTSGTGNPVYPWQPGGAWNPGGTTTTKPTDNTGVGNQDVMPTPPITSNPYAPRVRGHFASGVTDFSGGLAYVHAGELLVNLAPHTSVIPAGRSGSIGGGHTFNITVNAPSGNGPDIAATVRYAIADMMRSYTPLPNITSGGRL